MTKAMIQEDKVIIKGCHKGQLKIKVIMNVVKNS